MIVTFCHAAVLVWLNYKNAYEYWNEQRLALNKEVQTATAQVTASVMDKLPLGAPSTGQSSSPAAMGTLFLQLTVDDMGICVPMSTVHQVRARLPLVREKSGKFKVREKSGNFRICQGKLKFC